MSGVGAHVDPTAETTVDAGVAAKARNGLRSEAPARANGLRSEAPARAGDDFVSRVLAVVESIPPGRVMAYGEVAAAIGSRAARGVGQVMAYYGDGMPWWRVIRASGQPPLCHDEQALEHYRDEGTPLVTTPSGYRVNLPLARHRP